MAEAMIAIIAAVVGGFAGAAAGWYTSRHRARSERAWEIAFAVSAIQAQILSAGTPSTLKSKTELDRLKLDWQVAHRRFYLLGHQEAADALTDEINRYLDRLSEFVADEISREKLESARTQTRDAVTEIMRKFSNG
jgi:hypothetical protein